MPKQPDPPTGHDSPEGSAAAKDPGVALSLTLRELVLTELSRRMANTLFEELVLKGLATKPGQPGCPGCSGTCQGDCKGSCLATCSGSCDNTCGGTCSGDCSSTCTGDCSGTSTSPGAERPRLEDLIAREILTVTDPAVEAFRNVLIRAGFPR